MQRHDSRTDPLQDSRWLRTHAGRKRRLALLAEALAAPPAEESAPAAPIAPEYPYHCAQCHQGMHWPSAVWATLPESPPPPPGDFPAEAWEAALQLNGLGPAPAQPLGLLCPHCHHVQRSQPERLTFTTPFPERDYCDSCGMRREGLGPTAAGYYLTPAGRCVTFTLCGVCGHGITDPLLPHHVAAALETRRFDTLLGPEPDPLEPD